MQNPCLAYSIISPVWFVAVKARQVGYAGSTQQLQQALHHAAQETGWGAEMIFSYPVVISYMLKINHLVRCFFFKKCPGPAFDQDIMVVWVSDPVFGELTLFGLETGTSTKTTYFNIFRSFIHHGHFCGSDWWFLYPALFFVFRHRPPPAFTHHHISKVRAPRKKRQEWTKQID